MFCAIMRGVKYRYVLITGASSGLGAAFADALAAEGTCLHLAARRQQPMEELAERIRRRCPGAEVTVHVCDLSQEADTERLLAAWQALPPGPTLLINNAGLGDYGDYAGSSWERDRCMVQVNVQAPLRLTHGLLPRLAEQGGGVINLASLAADLPIPDFALYAATKACLASFSEGLRLELRQAGVPVLAVCPGPVHTGFGEVARRAGCTGNTMPLRRWFYTPVHTVVRCSLRALAAGRARCYPSLKVRLAALLLRCMPLWLLRAVLSLRPRRVSSIPPATVSQKS